MQDPRIPQTGELSNPKPRKKKNSTPRTSVIQLQGNDAREIQQMQGQKASSKRNLKNKGSTLFQQPEWSNSDSLPDSSAPGNNEYRTLRRKYLLLEEESFSLGTELREVEGEVKTLEEEKLALLDRLVVLEGLIDPSEMQPHKSQLP